MDKLIREGLPQEGAISVDSQVGDTVVIEDSLEIYIVENKTPADPPINPYIHFGLRSIATGRTIDYEIRVTDNSVRRR
ncbi:MAG: hypothetical protein KGI73_03980 [Patescibacteria group bacterium]|nr:hypothetical protein [Patescibacteria group bacterium]